ncbi:3alpha(or 20beta)-hydroxysteroid dehydrogenase [Lentibacillus halodurans]|uniref:3alpha(Or 20beta)-hydroxysteroid dehydrogenase n=1 Tax=Lentibacillus halodurans TaxID=237679 RepID=A0A1I0XGR6_9BACI|nr:glucose 1-dehydrogenase [Lentibacillus halodurans]SFB00094.1 3alpha(or 20beta)-hydroxysteroid dehydrogenase [Lentibacillus halodurans]
MGKLDGKVAVITGGSRGQGASHVRNFVEEGARVVFSDILIEEGEGLANELGENVKFVKHDVTNADEWKQVTDETEKTFGPVNILVNNAGIVVTKNFEDLSEEMYRKVVDINQVGVFLGIKTALSSMRKTGNGSIINVSSINGLRGSAGNAAYDSSKFAVRGITKSAAMEFAEYGIRVNSVHPGIIQTPMIEKEGSEELVEEMKKTIPIKRTAHPEEVSKLIVYLPSDDSSYSTGSEFIADGGITASN